MDLLLDEPLDEAALLADVFDEDDSDDVPPDEVLDAAGLAASVDDEP
ncbi:MAG: hypothetical protein JWP31_1786 [Aeromicrobium sp.]|nr:hypothetical protein [Aeromicrobium sp.]